MVKHHVVERPVQLKTDYGLWCLRRMKCLKGIRGKNHAAASISPLEFLTPARLADAESPSRNLTDHVEHIFGGKKGENWGDVSVQTGPERASVPPTGENSGGNARQNCNPPADEN